MTQSIITQAFETYKAQQEATKQPVLLDEFVLALVPGLDPNIPIDREETVPADEHIVYVADVTQDGFVSPNAVVYSLIMDTRVGDFEFNWLGLRNKATGVLAAILHIPAITKYQSVPGLQNGNAVTRSILMSYEGAQQTTSITVDASTWQIDFTARLAGIDDTERLSNLDVFGPAAFLNEGFKVEQRGEGYVALAGQAYVGGLRCHLSQNLVLINISPSSAVYLDASWQGQPTSRWQCVFEIKTATTLVDYTDEAGYRHYVAKVADIDSQGRVIDRRFLEGFARYYRQPVVDNLLNQKVDKSAITESVASSSNALVASAKGLKKAWDLATRAYQRVAEAKREAIESAVNQANRHSNNTKLAKTGGTMTGNLTFVDNVEGIVWSRNTDGAFIKFKNNSDQDTNSYLEFGTLDNGNEFFKWTIDGVEEATLKRDGLRVANTIYEAGTALSNKYLGKTAKAADANKLDGMNSTHFCRAFSASYNTGVGTWTTAQLVAWLKSKGALAQPYWMMKASWSYGANRVIRDTGCGTIHLAGCVIEVFGHNGAYNIRITTPTTATSGGTTNATFIYTNHGSGYAPSWRRDYNTRLKPTAADVGALTKRQADGYYLGKSAKASRAAVADKTKVNTSSSRSFYSVTWHSGDTFFTAASGGGMSYRPNDGFSKIKHGYLAGTYLTHDTSGKLKARDTNKRTAGLYGIYDSHRIGHIWSMGEAYKIHDRGANFGNLYGLAYKHTNNGTGGTMAGGHQAVWCENGQPRAALGSNGLWGLAVYDGGGNNRKRVYSPNNPPPKLGWHKVKSGSCNFSLANGRKVFRGTIDTGVAASGWVHNSKKYRVVLITRGTVHTRNSGACHWSAIGEVYEETKFSGPSRVKINVYTTCGHIQSGGAVHQWELWELR